MSFFLFLAVLCSLQDLSSPARDPAQVLAVKVPRPNHWNTREFPADVVLHAPTAPCACTPIIPRVQKSFIHFFSIK